MKQTYPFYIRMTKKVACQVPGDAHTLNGVSPFLLKWESDICPSMDRRPEIENDPGPACEQSRVHHPVKNAASARDTLCCLNHVAKGRPRAPIPRWGEAISKGYSPCSLGNHSRNHMQKSLSLPTFMIILIWFKGLDRIGWDFQFHH